MRPIDRIYVHCSAIPWGTVESIREFHVKTRGWSDIGYHFVIGNGWKTRDSMPLGFDHADDGKVYAARGVEHIGAHVLGDNKTSIGICLIGYNCFSSRQMMSLIALCKDLMADYGIDPQNIFGHREFWQMRGQPIQKECPYFDVGSIRSALTT